MTTETENADRIATCVAACHGIEDPAKAVVMAREALATAQTEAITMVGRLPEPYRSNQTAVAEMCKAAIQSLTPKTEAG